jgi:hypothetical protein
LCVSEPEANPTCGANQQKYALGKNLSLAARCT